MNDRQERLAHAVRMVWESGFPERQAAEAVEVPAALSTSITVWQSCESKVSARCAACIGGG